MVEIVDYEDQVSIWKFEEVGIFNSLQVLLINP
jgi:hypothetical protein